MVKRTAVVLAAGRGTRLHPLTLELPKCLVDIAGRPLLEYLLTEFADWAERVVVVSGHAHEALDGHIQRVELHRNIIVVYNERFDITNSLASAALSLPFWEDSEEVVVTNSDVIFAAGALRPLFAAQGDCVAAVVPKSWDAEDMKVRVDHSVGEIRAVSKEIAPPESFGEFTGVLKLRGAALQEMRATMEQMLLEPEMERGAWYDLALDRMARAGAVVRYVTIHEEDYAEIDTLEDLETVRRRFNPIAS
jgi:choline kinase